MSLSPPRSREETPSTTSSQQSSTLPNDNNTSSGMSVGGGSSQGSDDAERFRKRIEFEQNMQMLQQRLKFATMKAENGWSGMTISEVEKQLPPSPRRVKRDDMRIATDKHPAALSYEPPSPSRPWQLIDVLWQPLPPPSRGPASPSSPLKRSRTDDEDGHPPRQFNSGLYASRRASGSFPRSPADQVLRREKKRSQSHSTHSRQDVNAAKALTEMFGSGSGSSSAGRRSSLQAPGLSSHSSLPLPPAFEHRPLRRASSVTPVPDRLPDEEDKDAAELMMFLAHSPSAGSQPKRSQSPARNIGRAARVLFADDEDDAKGKPGDGKPPVGLGVNGPLGNTGKVERHSNLVLAPPIVAESLETRG